MGRPPSIQWYYKQWLGDQKVLGMDWDAKAMHFHLLMISIQEEPPGSLPDDIALIRRWLGSPSDDVWRRVRPQVFSAWTLRSDRWFNPGMEATMERAEKYRNRYETGTKKPAESMKTEDSKDSPVSLGSKSKPSFEEVSNYCLERGNFVDPRKWFDHYTANGWKVGRNPMKDWRAAIRTWEGNNRAQQSVSKVEERTQRNRKAILAGLGISPNVGSGGTDNAPRGNAGRNPLLVGDVQD